jgi:hypothetical protein
MKFTIRWPRIRVSKKGKVSVVNAGVSLGNKNARINVGRQGVSTSVGVPGARLNSRRGLLLSPFTLLARLFRRKR